MERPIDQPESPYEAARRVNNLLRLGTIEQLRLQAPARCRVRTGGLLTGWLPWLTLRAGGGDGGRLWSPPVIDEQVLVIAPGGDLAQAVVLPGVYSDAMPQGSDQAGVFQLDFGPGASLYVNPDPDDADSRCIVFTLGDTRITMGHQRIELAADGGSLVIDQDGVHGEPDVISGSVSLRQHKHGGVQTGQSLTGEPAA